MTSPQNKPNPTWPTCKDSDGKPIRIGIYELVEYLGYRRKDVLFKGHHYYRVKCVFCHAELKRMQDSIRQAARKKVKGCVHCSKARSRDSDAANRARASALRKEKFYEWVQVLHTWPTTPLQFRKGFDSELAIKAQTKR